MRTATTTLCTGCDHDLQVLGFDDYATRVPPDSDKPLDVRGSGMSPSANTPAVGATGQQQLDAANSNKRPVIIFHDTIGGGGAGGDPGGERTILGSGDDNPLLKADGSSMLSSPSPPAAAAATAAEPAVSAVAAGLAKLGSLSNTSHDNSAVSGDAASTLKPAPTVQRALSLAAPQPQHEGVAAEVQAAGAALWQRLYDHLSNDPALSARLVVHGSTTHRSKVRACLVAHFSIHAVAQHP
jgi:hypothetical protein